MNDDDFLKKFQGRFETIGKEGIIGIMKTAHIDISKELLNQYPTYSISKSLTKTIKHKRSIKLDNSNIESKTNKKEFELKKKLPINKSISIQNSKFSHNNTKKDLQLPYIFSKKEQAQISTITSDTKKNKNTKSIKQPIKLRKGSIDDVMTKKIKREDNNINNLTCKIQNMLIDKQEQKKRNSLKKDFFRKKQNIKIEKEGNVNNRLCESTITPNNVQEKDLLKKIHKTKNIQIDSNNHLMKNTEQNKNNSELIIKTLQPQFVYHKKNRNEKATKDEFERLLLQRQSYQHFLPYNSSFK